MYSDTKTNIYIIQANAKISCSIDEPSIRKGHAAIESK